MRNCAFAGWRLNVEAWRVQASGFSLQSVVVLGKNNRRHKKGAAKALSRCREVDFLKNRNSQKLIDQKEYNTCRRDIPSLRVMRRAAGFLFSYGEKLQGENISDGL
jgi:hypothetical protein